MAYLRINKMEDNKTEMFLLDAGYTNSKTCSDKALWSSMNFPYDFFIDTKLCICSYPQLIGFIYKEGYNRGLSLGKKMANTEIKNNISRMLIDED